MFKDYMGNESNFVFFTGVVEDNSDPLTLGRCKVRCFGFHTEDKSLIPTKDLPWATVLIHDNTRSPNIYQNGDWVMGFFTDGNLAQYPVILGMIPGIVRPGAPNEQGNTNTQGDYNKTPPYHGQNITGSNNGTNLPNSTIGGGNDIRDNGIYVHHDNKDKYPLSLHSYDKAGGRGIACKDGSLRIHYPSALALDELAKQHKGSAFTINSGYRSPSYNASVGGARNSYHTQGRAFDIAKSSIGNIEKFLTLAARNGFVGFGMYPTFIHIDTGNGRVWGGFTQSQMEALKEGGWYLGKKGLQGVKFDAAKVDETKKEDSGLSGADAQTNETGGGAVDESNKTVQSQIENYYKEKGFTPSQTAGVLAHAQGESSLNPNAYRIDSNGKPSYGLFQWNGPRFESLKNWSSQQGLDYKTVEAQLKYKDYELNTTQKSAGNALKNASTPAEASLAMNSFEKFQGWKDAYSSESLKRINLANKFAGGYQNPNALSGFYDPTNSFPAPEYRGNPTTHPNARGLNSSQFNSSKHTNVQYTGFPVAGNKGTFGSPPNSYAPQYPYNKVFASNSGHIIELDDTPQAERVAIKHKSGTSSVITANGSRNDSTLGHHYNFNSMDYYLGVQGSFYQSVVGDINLRSTTDVTIQSDGSATELVYGDKTATISGEFNLLVGGVGQIKAKKIILEADEIHVYSKGNVHMQAEGNLELSATSKVIISGKAGVDIKSDADLKMSATGNTHIKGTTVYMDDVIRMAEGGAQDAAYAQDAESTDLGKAPPVKKIKKVDSPKEHPDTYTTTEQASEVYSV